MDLDEILIALFNLILRGGGTQKFVKVACADDAAIIVSKI